MFAQKDAFGMKSMNTAFLLFGIMQNDQGCDVFSLKDCLNQTDMLTYVYTSSSS